MSKGFTFEKNLPHQKAGVDALMSMFVGAEPQQSDDPIISGQANPVLSMTSLVQSYKGDYRKGERYNRLNQHPELAWLTHFHHTNAKKLVMYDIVHQ
jgi:type III restriction enzyme